MSRMEPHIETFLGEAHELLADIEAAVLELESSPGDGELIDRVFRAMHTIKGSGAMFGFDDVAGFTHHLETALDLVREGHYSVSKELIDIILASRDYIAGLLQAAIEGTPPDMDEGGRITDALQQVIPAPDANNAEVVSAAQAGATGADAPPEIYQVRIKLDPDVMKTAWTRSCCWRNFTNSARCSLAHRLPMFPRCPNSTSTAATSGKMLSSRHRQG